MDETKRISSCLLRLVWIRKLAVASALQIALDRAKQLGWMESKRDHRRVHRLARRLYYFFAHSLTTAKPFIQFAISRQRISSAALVHGGDGWCCFRPLALSSPYLQT